MRKLIPALATIILLTITTACGATIQTGATSNNMPNSSTLPNAAQKPLIDQLLATKWAMDGSKGFIEFTSEPYTEAQRADTALGKVYTLKASLPSYNGEGYIITDKCPATGQIDSFGTTPITSWADCGEGATAFGTLILDAGQTKTGWGDGYYLSLSLSPDGQSLTIQPLVNVRSIDGSMWDEEGETPSIARNDPVWADSMSVNGNALVLKKQN